MTDLEDPRSELSRLWDKDHDLHVLRALLDKIRPEFHAETWGVFERLVFHDASARDVAREFQISPNAVYIARSRVLKRLRLEGKGLID